MDRKILKKTEKQLRSYAGGTGGDTQSQKWSSAIDKTLKEYRSSGEEKKAELIEMRYFGNMCESEILKRIHVSRNTYFSWKKDVLCTIAFYAACSGAL